jgi:RNA polymerase sigma factor (sigma-70 family)
LNELGPELLSRLLDEHSARLILFAQQWCGTPEDVVQEAFVRLMRVQPTPDDLAAWLYRVVRNGAISASRSSSRRARHESSAATGRQTWFASSSDDHIDAESAVVAMQSLPLVERETVVLRLWSNLSFEQIAELTETSASTAHRRYVNGIAALRNQLRIPSLKSGRPDR